MGLLQHLGLTPLPSMALADGDDAPERRSGGDGDDAPSKGKDKVSPADALDAKLGTALDALGTVLDGIHDDAGPRPCARRCKSFGRRSCCGRRDGAPSGSSPRSGAARRVAKQRPVADAALKKAQAVEKREAARKEIDVALGQVTAMVPGGINPRRDA
jgi:hypothetical protein